MVKALTTHAGDRWFDPGESSFAEKSDYFMIFEVHLQSESDCSLAGKPRNSNPAVLWLLPKSYRKAKTFGMDFISFFPLNMQ